MAQTGGVNLRGDLLAIHSLDHFALSVPDLADAKKFYSEFGLDVRDSQAGLELYTFNHLHRWGVIRQGARKKLDYLSFGVFEDDLARFKDHLKQRSIPLIAAPAGAEAGGVWIRSPDGTPIELRTAEKCTPSQKTKLNVVSVGPGECAAIARSKAPRVYPARLSHVLLFSTDVLRDVAFYRDNLGLRLSDHSGGGIAFMHGAHGSDHHLIALAASNAPGIHHSSWDVSSIQEVGLGWSHMAGAGYDKGWGLGRHVLGANYFHYVRDPWGSYAEYSCDIDFIPAGFDWPAADHPPEDSLYLWGPPVPEDFIVNYEA